jgi:hypothetical protein
LLQSSLLHSSIKKNPKHKIQSHLIDNNGYLFNPLSGTGLRRRRDFQTGNDLDRQIKSNYLLSVLYTSVMRILNIHFCKLMSLEEMFLKNIHNLLNFMVILERFIYEINLTHFQFESCEEYFNLKRTYDYHNQFYCIDS